jgi:hypothetical protein
MPPELVYSHSFRISGTSDGAALICQPGTPNKTVERMAAARFRFLSLECSYVLIAVVSAWPAAIAHLVVRRFDQLPNVLRLALCVFTPPFTAGPAALGTRSKFTRVIPQRIFLVAIVPPFSAAGATFRPLSFVAAGRAYNGAVTAFNSQPRTRRCGGRVPRFRVRCFHVLAHASFLPPLISAFGDKRTFSRSTAASNEKSQHSHTCSPSSQTCQTLSSRSSLTSDIAEPCATANEAGCCSSLFIVSFLPRLAAELHVIC